jgi:YHS domain-containing protein
MKLYVGLCLILASGLMVAAAFSDEKRGEKEWKAICPVSGQAADKSVSSDYKGGKVYFCCAGCPGKFEKETAKYATKANHQLAVTGQAEQVACPLTGKDVNAEKSAEVGGVKTAFCCGGCLGQVAKASAEEQVELVFGKGFEKGFKVKKASE